VYNWKNIWKGFGLGGVELVSRILGWINLAIAAVRGAFAIKAIVEGELPIDDKITGVSLELSKVTAKLQKIAAATAVTWDDDFADTLKAILDSIAEGMLDDLVSEGLVTK